MPSGRREAVRGVGRAVLCLASRAAPLAIRTRSPPRSAALTKAPAIITGKPSLHALRFIAHRLGVQDAEVGVVGDDPLVEMIMARRGGATAFGV